MTENKPTYNGVSDYLEMTRYTYDDLARYFAAIRKFNVCEIPFDDPIYGIIRKRISELNHWTMTYQPVIKRN